MSKLSSGLICCLGCLRDGICGEGIKKVKLAIKPKNSIEPRLRQSTSAIKANAHGQSAAAMKAESRRLMKAESNKGQERNLVAAAAMKAIAHKFPG